MIRNLLLVACACVALNVHATKPFRKPATYQADSKAAAEAAAKAICAISHGEGCAAAPATCKDTSMDDTTSTQVCKIVITTVKGMKAPGGLDYKVDIMNGRVVNISEHCGMCD